MSRSADTVAGSKQAANRGHRTIAPVPSVRRADIFWSGNPNSAAARVRAKQIRFGRHQLRRCFLGLDVLTSPNASLADTHVEEVFPRFGLQGV